MTAAIHYDITHLASRFWTETPAGIDRIDHAFARALTGEPGGIASGVHQGFLGASHVAPARVRRLAARLERRWMETLRAPENDPLWKPLTGWLTEGAQRGTGGVTRLLHARAPLKKLARLHTLYRLGFTSLTPALTNSAPNSVYVSAGLAGLTRPDGLSWLSRRPDVRSAFFVHDLLPLQRPDLFPEAIASGFASFLPNLAQHAAALIFASENVRDETLGALRGMGRQDIAALVIEPPPVPNAAKARFDRQLARTPYFVTLGTIEPRKNHMLLLDVWDKLAADGAAVIPKLLIVGSRGWKNAAILDRLRESVHLRDHVIEIGGLSTPAVTQLLAHSAGLLFPSLAEGFGLPVSEARAAGAPVLASDIPVLRERTLSGVELLPATDAPAWRAAIERLAQAHGAGDAIEARITRAGEPGAGADAFAARLIHFLNAI